jgi:hypothetical protein
MLYVTLLRQCQTAFQGEHLLKPFVSDNRLLQNTPVDVVGNLPKAALKLNNVCWLDVSGERTGRILTLLKL